MNKTAPAPNVIPLARPDRHEPAPSRDDLLQEVEQLRLQIKQHENALSRMADAVIMLRRGSLALRDENRDLRLELEASRRVQRQHARAS